MESRKVSSQSSPYAFLSLGFEFIFVFMAFALLGWLHDIYAPWASSQAGLGLLVGLFLGFFGALWHLYRRSQDIQQVQEQGKKASLGENTKQEALKTENIKEFSQDIEELRKRLEKELDS